MKIDRHNYEEYFLLYLDNELSIEDKKQVETFVKENPDLEEEFLMFQQSKLIADDSIVFDAKETLMKDDTLFINMANYEEWLVLYADNELTDSEKAVVEDFAAQHPHIKEELALFEKTRLQPEKIVFANKEVLYRKEEKPVIAMRWWKIAVAAILILGLGFGTYSVLNNNTGDKNNGPDLSSINNNKNNNNNTTTDKKEGTAVTNTNPGVQENKEDVAVKNNDQQDQQKSNPDIIPTNKDNKSSNNNNALAKQDNNSKTTDQQKDNFIAQNNANTVIDNTPETTTRPVITGNTDIDNTKPTAVFASANPVAKEKDFNIPAVTNEDPKTPSISKDAVASNDKKEKGTLRGFFRKATRFVQRTTKINPANDDDRVLIGGMAINLK